MPIAGTKEKELERKRKISEASRLHWQNPEFKAFVSAKLRKPRPNQRGIPPWNKGRKGCFTDETIRKMRASAIKRGDTPESHTPEVNAKRNDKRTIPLPAKADSPLVRTFMGT